MSCSVALSRRSFLAGSSSIILAGCTTTGVKPVAVAPSIPVVSPGHLAMYGALTDNGFVIDGLELSHIDPEALRQVVQNATGEPPGTIVVDTDKRRLYLTLEGGQAIRYGIGVGKEGLAWGGRATIRRKAAWPRWRPTANMIRRDPRNAEWANGMDGGLANPLGARALYLYQGDRDTLYRLHGTNEPWSIGEAVSSGCIRLFNHDIIDLYARVPIGTPVVVRHGRRIGTA